jgi:cytochrome c oxidase assembly protein subunit 15
VVTLHLLGGIGLLTLFLWLHLCLRRCCQNQTSGHRTASTSRLGRAWWLVIGLLVVQLMLGGWTSSNYAGLACQGFPTCNGQWLPALDWGEGFHLTQSVGPNYLHGSLHAEARTAIHVAHRLGALFLLLALSVLSAQAWSWSQRRAYRPERYWLLAALGVCLFQAGLGIANVLLWLPLWLALMHTGGAVALVICTVMAAWQCRYPASGLGDRRAQEVQREGGEPWLMAS